MPRMARPRYPALCQSRPTPEQLHELMSPLESGIQTPLNIRSSVSSLDAWPETDGFTILSF